MPDPTPRLRVRRTRQAGRGSPAALVIILPGGQSESDVPMWPFDVAYLRMLPFETQLRSRVTRPQVAVATLRYGVRGWNGPRQSPVHDARRALRQVQRRWPGMPVILLGHSMGGRVAMHLGGDDGVTGVVGLAPWLSHGDPCDQLAGQRVVIYHGTADVMTDPDASREFVRRARTAGADASFVPLSGLEHTMLRSFWVWQQRAVAAVVALTDPSTSAVAIAARS